MLEIVNTLIFDLTVERLKPMIETRRMKVNNQSYSDPSGHFLGAFLNKTKPTQFLGRAVYEAYQRGT